MPMICWRTSWKSAPLGYPLLNTPGTFSQQKNLGRTDFPARPRCTSAFRISFVTRICSRNSPDRTPASRRGYRTPRTSPGTGCPADDIHRRQLRPVQSGDVPNVEHLREMMLRTWMGNGSNLAGPQRGDALTHGGQREAANAVKQASHRRHMLRIVPFRAGTQSHSLRCSASPTQPLRWLARGPRHCSGHFYRLDNGAGVLTAAWAV